MDATLPVRTRTTCRNPSVFSFSDTNRALAMVVVGLHVYCVSALYLSQPNQARHTLLLANFARCSCQAHCLYSNANLVMSSSDASSSDSEAITQTVSNKSKGKAKQQPSVVVTPHGKNEGTNQDWAFQVPPGATLINTSKEADEFDWDTLESNEDLELWVIRVPEGVRAI